MDRNLGAKIVPGRLSADGWKIEIHANHFPKTENEPEVDDTVWIKYVGEKGWVILSADQRMLYNPLESEALKQCGCFVFLIQNKNLTGPQIGETFIRAKSSIFRLIQKKKHPGIFKISTNTGALQRWVPARSKKIS